MRRIKTGTAVLLMLPIIEGTVILIRRILEPDDNLPIRLIYFPQRNAAGSVVRTIFCHSTSDLDVSISGKSGVSISYPALDSGAQESVLSYVIPGVGQSAVDFRARVYKPSRLRQC